MASYHVEIKSGRKGSGAEHARYITREGKFNDRDDLALAGYGNMPDWALNDPLAFWRAADKYERANGAVYREWVIALPNEFDQEQSKAFVVKVLDGLLGSKPYQYAVHRGKAKLGGVDNNHAHIVYSDRKSDGLARSPEQTFKRYNREHPELGGCKKDSGGRTSMELRDEVIAKRKLIADIQNQMLSEMGSAMRVDHRSYRERGIQRQPERHLGQARVRNMSEQERVDYVALRNDS